MDKVGKARAFVNWKMVGAHAPTVAKLYIVARVDPNKFAVYLSVAIADVNRTK